MKSIMLQLVPVLSLLIHTVAADVPNPVFWERAFTINITNANNEGTLNQSTSFMATSQDFQGIHIDANPKNPPDRIIFNFGDSCQSDNTTIDYIRQINFNSIDVAPIVNAQKIALVKRGNCNWSEKVSVVNSLALANHINITAVFIYDNETHGTNISIVRTAVAGSGSIGPPSYTTPLPAARSILNMTDNDVAMSNPSATTVYFLPFVYGNTFVQRINASYDPSNPTIMQYWLLTPYMEEVSWGFSSGDGFFSTGRGYLSYIIALAAIFLIGVIFLRWWRIRRMGVDYPNGGGGFTGFTTANGFSMQPRVTQVDPLPVDIVNSLPIEKYSVDLIKNVNCAICLEDFVPGKNDIRILPCGHGFCVLCIDPWLTQKSTMCPICKWDCLPVDLRRERNEQNQNARQQQQHTQVEDATDIAPPPNEATAIDMTGGVPDPSSSSTVVSPQVYHVENAEATATTTTAGTVATTRTSMSTPRILPPTLLPSSSPPSTPKLEKKEFEVTQSENPFEQEGTSTTISERHQTQVESASSSVKSPFEDHEEKKFTSDKD